MKTLVELFSDYAKTQPSTYFVADGYGTVLNYADAWNRVKYVAYYLSCKRRLCKGDTILVKCNQSVEYLIIYLACNLIGAVFIPVEGNASAQRINDIAEEAECKLYVNTIKENIYYATETYENIFNNCRDTKNDFNVIFPNPEDIAEILYTTGTTGKSKGIVLKHSTNIALAENIKHGVNMKPHNIELIPLVMSHSHGLRTFYANLLNGGTVVITDGVMNVKAIFNLMEKFNVTSMDLSPSAAQVLIKLSKGTFWEKAKDLDYIEIGTAALPETLKEELVQNLPGVHLYNFYGSTESGRTCALDFSVAVGKKKCIGKPSINANIVFTDDDRNPIKATPDNPGLLASSGSMNMVCYYKNPKLTKKILVNGFVCTNDLGYYDEEGYAYVVGRRDDVINCNGIKISPTEIEDIVSAYPNILETACVGIEDSVAGQIPKLFVVPKDLNAFDMNQFQAYLYERIDRTKMPKTVVLIDALPRTYNGKLDRKALKKI